MKGSAQKLFNKAIANNQNPRIINIDKSGCNFTAIREVNRNDFWNKNIKFGGVNTLIIVLNKTSET
jgi:transposase-like protein